jgi:plasmid replication initiation protein
MSEAGKDRQLDIFQAAYADIPIRDQRDLMERPFFSLAKTPRLKPIEYAVAGVSVRVTPGGTGLATIWDADILIWLATQITEALDRGGEVSPVIRFHPYTLLRGIRRHTGGDQYKKLLNALRRLHSTSVETNIRQRGTKGWAFHWIEEWGHQEDEEGKPLGMSITLPRWLYEGIIDARAVLTIHPDYFLLKGGIERWLYRVARKHAGNQEGGWRFSMRQLYEKSGSMSRFANFAIDIRKTVSANVLPEYALEITRSRAGEEVVYMYRRAIMAA